MINKKGIKVFFAGLILLEVLVAWVLFLSMVFPNLKDVDAGVGQNNVTVVTLLQVGNVFPEVINITLSPNFDLSPNVTATINATVVARDYNGDTDITNVTLYFFDNAVSTYGAADDNNNHYTNTTCTINYTYGDTYQIKADCVMHVWYYADNATWNATVVVTDNESLTARSSNTTTINTLLALALPDSIDYGIVNALNVSDEKSVNVFNAGNVPVNLSLSGYAVAIGDNKSMNCSLGSLKNISINYEKYNLTTTTAGALNISQFETTYTNLTSSNVSFKRFDLGQRQNDTKDDAVNATYWRMYVPLGVAGSCRGNIVFGAYQGFGS